VSELVDRDATDIRLEANNQQCLIRYRKNGEAKKCLVWGGVNGNANPEVGPPVELQKNYLGKGFGADTSSRYKGPGPTDGLGLVVSSVTVPNGSHWVAQKWRRMQPNYGLRPDDPLDRAVELHVSHFSGPLPQLEVWSTWAPNLRDSEGGHVLHRLLARHRYKGKPVYGIATNRFGAPLSVYERNMRISVQNGPADYVRYRQGGKVWQRENGIICGHRRSGVCCYGFGVRTHDGRDGTWKDETIPVKAGRRGPATGSLYLCEVEGPGATPITFRWADGLPSYDPSNPKHVDRVRAGNELLRIWYAEAGEPIGKCQPSPF
jgi:hypothetical protein